MPRLDRQIMLFFSASIFLNGMKNKLVTIFSAGMCLLFILQNTPSSVATLSPLMSASRAPSSDKTGYYIVVLREDTSLETFQNILSQVAPISMDAHIHGSVQRVMKAFTVKLSDHALNIVSMITAILITSCNY